MKRIAYIFPIILFLSCPQLTGQNEERDLSIADRSISPAVPFLRVSADARASGMANIGTATPSTTYAQQWNPAKYVFAQKQQGIGVSYTPYLRKLTHELHIGQINYYNRINTRSAFAGSIRYFNLGTVESRQSPVGKGLPLKPNQLAFDGSYALQLSEVFSMAVTARYIRSDLKLQTSYEAASAANSFSMDISGFYEGKIIPHPHFKSQWRAGFNLSNIGPKIKYSANIKSFLPTNLSIGAGYDFIFDADNTVGVYIQFDKLVVPTPSDSNYDGLITREDDYYSKGALEGLFSSFNDAPGGFSEEMKEITWAIGAEYRYRERFDFRIGYFHESPDKGYRQYLTLGTGFRYSIIKINLSYLFNTANEVNNALEGSLRFSIAFKFGKSF